MKHQKIDRSGPCTLCRKVFDPTPRDGICQACDDEAIALEKKIKLQNLQASGRPCQGCSNPINTKNYFFCSTCYFIQERDKKSYA